MLAENLGIGNSRREPAGPKPAERPDPGDPLLGERFRRAMMDDSADAPQDVAHQETLFDQEIFAELDRLEELIDDSGLRGAPSSELRDLAANLRAEPRARRELDKTARDCEAAGLRDTLTRELRVLLFPRAKRKGRR